jgi:hypothetical protein
MRKIHLKRGFNNRYTLCGITPNKDRFIAADLVASVKPENICKVCLRVLEIGEQADGKERTDA